MIFFEEKDDRFYIDESTQSGAGRGLFAAVDLRKGDFLEVKGVVVERGSAADLCTSYAHAYKFASDYPDRYTGHIIPMGYAAIVNRADEPLLRNVEINYVDGGGERMCVYAFTRDVAAGQEVLTDYGDSWRALLARGTDESQSTDEREWYSFLQMGLYNLGKLKRPGE